MTERDRVWCKCGTAPTTTGISSMRSVARNRLFGTEVQQISCTCCRTAASSPRTRLAGSIRCVYACVCACIYICANTCSHTRACKVAVSLRVYCARITRRVCM